MTQLTETVKHNADNARQANTLASRATSMADAGNETVQGIIGRIGLINWSSIKISEITGAVEGIAFPTNVLALNATLKRLAPEQVNQAICRMDEATQQNVAFAHK
ncbi:MULTISPECIES: methyl-accepting chemotaxis protein [Burkholderia cepacia complex]|nr:MULTISPECIES: methyl-accepting chemotaxis protein [Burkholderia cepacia complex]